MTPVEKTIAAHLTSHEGAWGLMGHTLRAINTDEDAGRYLRRHVRDLMGSALFAGYEGREPTPRRPGVDHYQKAKPWVGMQILRDVGPRGLSEVNWTRLGGELTAAAGTDLRPATAVRGQQLPALPVVRVGAPARDDRRRRAVPGVRRRARRRGGGMRITVERGTTPVAWRVPHTSPDYRRFVAAMKALHEHRAANGPWMDGDPLPFYACWGQFGTSDGIGVTDIPPVFFAGVEMKGQLVAMMLEIIGVARPRLFAWSTTMNLLMAGSPGAEVVRKAYEAGEPIPRFDTLEGYTEQGALHIFDAERQESWYRKVLHRGSNGRPAYGPWHHPPGDMDGDMIDPIREAMR